MHILLFAGSLKKESLNKKLVKIVERYLANQNIVHTYIDLIDFPAVVYNEDIERTTGIPQTVHSLADFINQADALIIATPEYNGSISSPLKNIVDWLSRCKPMPLAGKHLLLASASPAKFGGVRGIWQTRIPFEMLAVHVFPTMFSLESANMQFNNAGELGDTATEQRLKKLVDQFVQHVTSQK